MMDAGRELDALIALQVFRYTLDYEFAETLGAPCVRELRDGHDEWGMLPHYSTDMADAWLVVEQMRDAHDTGLILKAFPKGFQYALTVVFQSRENMQWHSLAPAAPLAICRAALKACGVPS
jgi:ABA sandwich protein